MWLDAKSTIKHNGEQMLSDEFLEEEKMSMGEGSFEQEYMLSLNADSQGIWYSKEIRKAYNDDRIKQYGIFSPDGQEYYGHYNPNEPVYCSWDLGQTDSTCICFFQYNHSNGHVRFFHYYQESGYTLEHYANYIKKYQAEKRIKSIINILPADADHTISSHNLKNMYDTAVKRVDILRANGLNCFVLNRSQLGMEKTRKVTRINNTRKWFDRIEIDDVECFLMLEGIKSYKKKYIKETDTYVDVPVHDWASDIADSFGYAFVYLENYMNSAYDGVDKRPKTRTKNY